MSLQQNIGIALKVLRAEKGISQEKLALETGIGRRYMSDIENGRRNISLEIIEKLSDFFQMRPSDFLLKIENAMVSPLTLDSLKEYLCARGYEETIILESPDYLSAIVGISDDARIIYDYEKMVKFLMISEGMDYEEAIEFIDFNTLGALPYMGEKRPIILNRIEG
ncbi:MAG: helix-turn-helix transcriptional regulator [Fibrobacteraceae bacterium]|nr:helix-turn-helix transcriptional regulator [Fibrobacteraceae bacterium]